MENRHIVKTLFNGLLVIFVALGCATLSDQHGSENEYRMPVTRIKELAIEEAYRHGWKDVHTDEVGFRDGFWRVLVYKYPIRMVGTSAWVKITKEGRVLEFAINNE